MPGIQMGGLASGIDTNGIISQLMSVERIPRFRIERQQAAAQARQDALRDIVTKLKTLRNAATDLQSASVWSLKQTATSSDAARVGAKTTGTAPAGVYDVAVTQLSTTASRTLSVGTHPAPSQLTITGSGGSQFLVDVPGGATVDTIVAAINSNTALPVVARSVNGALVMDARASGASGAFTVAGKVITGELSSVAGVNSLFSVNGVAYQSASRTDSAAIPGIELSLASLTTAGSPARVTVSEAAVDKDGVVAKLKSFVEAYNAVVDTIRSKTTEKREPNPQTNTDAKRGVLFGDSGLRQVLSSLRLGLMEPVSVGNTAAIDELAEIGVSTGAASAVSAEKNNGRLVFDEAKFTAAWEGGAGAGSVERLLRGAGDLTGYAQRLDGLIKPLTETGGLFEGRITASNGELTRLKDGLARMDARLERKESFYRAQFTALETALQRMQTQGAELASRLPQQKD